MLEKMKALLSLFKQGEAVADPAKWKNRQVTTTMLAGLIIAVVQLLRAFGHEVPIDTDTATAIAGGFIAVVNTIFTITTSKTIGLPSPPVREAEQTLPSNEQATEGNAEVATEQGVPSVSQPNVQQSSIDDDTRRRALEWAREHSKPVGPVDNGLHNDA